MKGDVLKKVVFLTQYRTSTFAGSTGIHNREISTPTRAQKELTQLPLPKRAAQRQPAIGMGSSQRETSMRADRDLGIELGCDNWIWMEPGTQTATDGGRDHCSETAKSPQTEGASPSVDFPQFTLACYT